MKGFVAGFIGLALVVVLVVAIGDAVAVHYTDKTVAHRIEQSVPGSSAKVSISSEPYIPNLAMFGRVDDLKADVSNVPSGGVTIKSIDVDAHNLTVNRNDLFKGQVRLQGVSSAKITTVVDPFEGMPASIRSQVRHIADKAAAGAQLDVKATGSGVKVSLPGAQGAGRGSSAYSVEIPFDPLLDCAGTATYAGGLLTMVCTTHTIPAAIAQP